MTLARSSVAFAVKLAVGAAVLALLLTRVDFDRVLDAAGHFTPVTITIAAALYFAAHFLNAAKLRLLLPQLSLWQAWRFTMIGILYSTALPGQVAGDAVKALRLARAADNVGDMGAAVAAVAVDKVISMFALLLLMALGIGLDTSVFGPRMTSAAVLVTGLACLALYLALATPLPAKLGRWGRGFAAWRTVALTPSILAKSLSLGLVFQGLSISVFMMLGRDLDIVLAPTAWAVVVGLVSVVLLLPITVAGIGLRDGSLMAVLGALGQSQSAALALSFSLLAINLLGATVGLVVDVTGRDRALKDSPP